MKNTKLKKSPVRVGDFLIKNILKEYKAQKELYEKFAAALTALLENMLRGYKYHLDWRVKSLESLKKKIQRKAAKGKTYEKLGDITDIAGIRIIFYTESDQRKFIWRMEEEFGDKMDIKERAKVSGYRALHAIVFLPEKRLAQAEYKAFRNLKCEVQLCLILEHAWAEIEHDILYKENWGFRQLDEVQYVNMKERMSKIMKNYIEKASGELERVVTKFKKLKRRNRKTL